MVRPLIQILQGANQKSGQRRAAARLLGTLGDPAVAPLLQVLQEAGPDPTARKYAIEALGQLRDARAVEPLIQALLTAESRGVRETAVRALGQLGDPRAVGPILKAMGEEEDGLIIYDTEFHIHNELVVDALVQIGAPAVAPLTQALRDPNPDVREIAHIVLAKIGSPGKRKD
ncbi:MAG: HEAT repeat domain-containing protein [Candidatus Heimdallarchaeota archaeon]